MKRRVLALFSLSFLASSGCSLTYNLHDRYTFDLIDGGVDSGMQDAGPAPGPTVALFPWNGFTTGSVWVPEGTPVADHPLRPKLMWHPTPGAERYEVQMEADCPIAGFRACTFPSPEVEEQTVETTFRPSALLEVSTLPPVGRRYVWRVRACNLSGCGGWSEPRYLDVGRHEGDFNGDGYADLVVGAYAQDMLEPDEGGAYLYYGSAAGLSGEPNVSFNNPANHLNGRFGNSVSSAGDVNGDGFSDLVIGAYQQSNPESAEGNAFVYYGGPGGLAPEPSVSLDNPSDQTNGQFGSSVSGVGDLDGDGYADFAVGAFTQGSPESEEGNVFVYYGGPAGIDEAPDRVLDNPADQEGGRFGGAVGGAGDMNGDGYADLVVGASDQSGPEEQEGVVFVYYGAAAGIAEEPGLILDNPSDQAGARFGGSLSGVGDVDGDGYTDLCVGADYQDAPEVNEGSAFLFRGGAGGLSPEPLRWIDNPSDQMSGHFGVSVTGAGDLNGDGFTDLVIGAPNQDNPEEDEGSAFVYEGGLGGPLESPSRGLDNPAGAIGGRFGSSLSGSGDLNGDGYDDLVVGAPSQTESAYREGNAFVFYGGPAGISEEPDLMLDNPIDQASGAFGSSVD